MIDTSHSRAVDDTTPESTKAAVEPGANPAAPYTRMGTSLYWISPQEYCQALPHWETGQLAPVRPSSHKIKTWAKMASTNTGRA